MIVQLCFGTNNSGHFSHTIYDCHQYTSHHQALNGEETKSRAELTAHETHSFALFHIFLIESTIDFTLSFNAVNFETTSSMNHCNQFLMFVRVCQNHAVNTESIFETCSVAICQTVSRSHVNNAIRN